MRKRFKRINALLKALKLSKLDWSAIKKKWLLNITVTKRKN